MATLDTISVIAITLILSYFTLVLGELVPKRVAMRHSEKLALTLSGLVNFVSSVFSPVVWLLTMSTNGLLRLMGIDPHAIDDDITEEEIRMMGDRGQRKGGYKPRGERNDTKRIRIRQQDCRGCYDTQDRSCGSMA
jgi:putative hemolysin